MKKTLTLYKNLFAVFVFLMVTFGFNVTTADALVSSCPANPGPSADGYSWKLDWQQYYQEGCMPAKSESCTWSGGDNGTCDANSLGATGVYEEWTVSGGNSCNDTVSYYAYYKCASDTPIPPPPPPPDFTPQVSLTPASQTITNGQSATLTWSSNLTSCSAPWTTSTAPSGSATVSPSSSSTFSIQCTTPAGVGSCTGTVVGSKDQYGVAPGPYEGDNCSRFLHASCGTVWETHGCMWDGAPQTSSADASAQVDINVVSEGVVGIGRCGPGAGVTPQNPEPTAYNACISGSLNSNSPADTSLAWNWSCGTVVNCSAPKYGCMTATDTNYNPTGPDNYYGCALTCKNGAPINTYPACTFPPASICNVTTDTNYNVGPCLGTCKNGNTNYPTCTTPPPPPSSTTAIIKVISNVSTTWRIPSIGAIDTGTTKSYTVTPQAGGSVYAISADGVPNYTGPMITNDVTGVGSTFVLYPSDAGSTFNFNLAYTSMDPFGCPTCDGSGFNYDLSSAPNVAVTPGGFNQIVITATLKNTTAQPISLSWLVPPAGIHLQASTCTPFSTPTCTSNVTVSVDSGVAPGSYPITITGSPLSKTVRFDVVVSSGVGGGGPLSVSCEASPLTTAKIGEQVTWTAHVIGGTGAYTYKWSGDGMPVSLPPSTNPYTLTYSTVGKKSAHVEVTDSQLARQSVDCNPASITIKINPIFKEQ